MRPAVLSSRRLIARHVPPAAQAVAEQWRRDGSAKVVIGPDEAVCWVNYRPTPAPRNPCNDPQDRGFDGAAWVFDTGKPQRVRLVLDVIRLLRRRDLRLGQRSWQRRYRRLLRRSALELKWRLGSLRAFGKALDQFEALLAEYADIAPLPSYEAQWPALSAEIARYREGTKRGPRKRDAAYEAQLLEPGNKAAIERAIFEYRGLLRGAQIDAVLDALPQLKPALSQARLESLFKDRLNKATRGRKSREE